MTLTQCAVFASAFVVAPIVFIHAFLRHQLRAAWAALLAVLPMVTWLATCGLFVQLVDGLYFAAPREALGLLFVVPGLSIAVLEDRLARRVHTHSAEPPSCTGAVAAKE